MDLSIQPSLPYLSRPMLSPGHSGPERKKGEAVLKAGRELSVSPARVASRDER